MSLLVLHLRTYVDDGHGFLGQQAQQFLFVHGIECVAVGKIVLYQPIYLGQAHASDITQSLPKLVGLWSSQAVDDVQASFFGLDQPRSAQHLQVSRSVGKAECRLPSQLLNAAPALSEKIKQLQAVRVRQRLPQDGELCVETILEGPAAHLSSLIKYSINLLSSIALQGPACQGFRCGFWGTGAVASWTCCLRVGL